MADNPKKQIYIISSVTNEANAHSESALLFDLFNQSDKKHSLTDNPAVADLIIFVDVSFENFGESVLNHPLVRRYPGKCFVHCHADNPYYFLHGIFASNSKRSIMGWKRTRTAAYTLMNRSYMNPFVRQFDLGKMKNVSKKYLFSFIGRNSYYIRDILFKTTFSRSDIKIENSDGFQFWKNRDGKLERQEHYYRRLLESKFSLCVRGTGTNSIRLFETLQLGICPVIISDGWIPPHGPNWKDFSIFIKEKNINELEQIIVSHEKDYQEMGKLSRKCFEDFFSEETYFNYLVENCLDIQKTQIIPEFFYSRAMPLYLGFLKSRSRIRKSM